MQLTISVCSPATYNFGLLSGSLLLWGYVNVSYSFRGFAEPESGLARWYSAMQHLLLPFNASYIEK